MRRDPERRSTRCSPGAPSTAGRPRSLVERDIETDPDLERAFLAEIPVVELGDRRLTLATSPARIERLLAEVLDG